MTVLQIHERCTVAGWASKGTNDWTNGFKNETLVVSMDWVTLEEWGKSELATVASEAIASLLVW